MCKGKQTIHYCTILSAGQWDFLLEGKASALRQKCLHRLMTGAVLTRTAYRIKGVDIVLEVGQAAASDVELAAFLECNRKTVGKLIDCFNRLGMLTTRTNNRTSIHSLHFLTGWYVGGVLIANPHYVRPAATAKGQTNGARTPVSETHLSNDGQAAGTEDRQLNRHDTDSIMEDAASEPPSLLSADGSKPSSDMPEDCNRPLPSAPGHSPDSGNALIRDREVSPSNEDAAGSSGEAQDGTDSGESNIHRHEG